jgi:hypothetical protein
MDYESNYYGVFNKASELQYSFQNSQPVRKPKGLAGRGGVSAEATFDDIDDFRARYVADIQNHFNTLTEMQAKVQEKESDLTLETSPVPKINPRSWESASFQESLYGEADDPTVSAILETIKMRESGGDYSVKNQKGSASGGYQFIDSTWKSLTNKYGIGTEYPSAKDAPIEVQDAVASSYVKDILAENDNDVSKVPLVWYTGNPEGKMSKEAIAVNNGLTSQEYQYNWLRAYNRITGASQ